MALLWTAYYKQEMFFHKFIHFIPDCYQVLWTNNLSPFKIQHSTKISRISKIYQIIDPKYEKEMGAVPRVCIISVWLLININQNCQCHWNFNQCAWPVVWRSGRKWLNNECNNTCYSIIIREREREEIETFTKFWQVGNLSMKYFMKSTLG